MIHFPERHISIISIIPCKEEWYVWKCGKKYNRVLYEAHIPNDNSPKYIAEKWKASMLVVWYNPIIYSFIQLCTGLIMIQQWPIRLSYYFFLFRIDCVFRTSSSIIEFDKLQGVYREIENKEILFWTKFWNEKL